MDHNYLYSKGLKKYVSKENLVQSSLKYIKPYGEKVFIIGGITALGLTFEKLEYSFRKGNISYSVREFNSECSMDEINKIVRAVKDYSPNLIIGIGGGKALDTAKAVAYFTRTPIITIPTIPATCTAWVPTSVLYSAEGVPVGGLNTFSPEYVLADLSILRKSPKKYFAAGLADSLAKWPELELGSVKEKQNFIYKAGVNMSLFTKNKCLDIANNLNWHSSSFEGENTSLLDELIDTSIFLTGLISEFTAGAMTGGELKALAHGIDEALLDLFNKSHEYCHGQRVAFGLIPHLLVFNAEEEFVEKVISCFLKYDLPIKISDFGLVQSDLGTLAKRTLDSTTQGMRGAGITCKDLEDALITSQEMIKIIEQEK